MDKRTTLKLLSDFVSIQSVSADTKRLGQILKAVDFLTNELKKMKFTVRLIKKGTSPPLIVATYLVNDRVEDKRGKTIGIYGHYDVQSEDPKEEWKTHPFQLIQRRGKLYGRGVADSKGHIVQNITAIKELLTNDVLTNNIIFILEGEEEVASEHFEDYVRSLTSVLADVDVFYIVDMGMYKKNIPQLMYGLRGLIYFELEAEIGERDLHSGLYGNRVYNPVQIVADLFAKMKDVKTQKVLIPEFYDKVRKISKDERVLLSKVSQTDMEQKNEAGVYDLVTLEKDQPYLSTKIYPSLDINGMISGYTGEGEKTIIPRKAMVKFSCRLVEFQDPHKVEKIVSTYIANNISPGARYTLKILSKTSPFYTDIKNPYAKKTAKILTNIFGNKTLFNRSGGTVGAAEVLQRVFKKPVLPLGFILPDANIHSPNENFDEEMFWKGIEALKKIYSQPY